jgi:peptidoglycan pentaglycine glycine transferase (the first glycine)
MPEVTRQAWEAFFSGCRSPHLLQSPAWGEFKSRFGWKAAWVMSASSRGSNAEPAVGAQVLFRRLPLGFTAAYIPKGPITTCSDQDAGQMLHAWENLWSQVDAACQSRRAVFLKVEPDVWLEPCSTGEIQILFSADQLPSGFQPSLHAIQPPRTILVDITSEEDRILGRMKQKTRYNLRLAHKRGVVVRSSADVAEFHRMMEITGDRDQFGTHSLSYYQDVYDTFHPMGHCELLLAEYEHTPLAGLMVFAHGGRAWYFYGASSNQHRDLMPTYLLQWEAIRWARQQGCWQYDLWGVPDEDEAVLEAQLNTRSDGLWGVYRNKRGYGGQVCRAAGPWDRIYQPALYRLYHWWAQRAQD